MVEPILLLPGPFRRVEDSIKKLMNCLRRWNNWCDSEWQIFKNFKIVISKSDQKAYLASAVDIICCICKDFLAVSLLYIIALQRGKFLQ